MLDQFGGRKFLFGVLLTILSFVTVLVGKLDIKSWLEFVGIVGATYIIVNVSGK